MARFKNTVSGVVVDVDASAAMRLPGSWEPLDEEPKKTARKRPSKKTEPAPEPEPKSDDE